MGIDRRTFLKTLGVAAGAVALSKTGVARADGRKVAIRLDKFEKLKTAGGSVVVNIKDKTVLLVRDSATTVRAFDPTCTHEECTVAFDDKKKTLVCPCHGGTYDLEGKVLAGPPPRALTCYAATLDGERVVITLPS